MQVSSRFLLVWAIVDVFPFLASSPFYSSMLVAWSITEIIRYSYFALSLSGLQPRFLTWLRYNTFFVLYPIGITSECALIWKATEPAGQVNELYKWALYAILAIYVPGRFRRNTLLCKLLTCARLLRPLHLHDEPETQGDAQLQGPECQDTIETCHSEDCPIYFEIRMHGVLRIGERR